MLGGLKRSAQFELCATVAGHALFWLLCVAVGYPKVFTDDLFYMGAAFALADGHGLTNPYLVRDVAGVTPFFSYPPLYFDVLAGWIKLFSRSPLSLQMFWALAQLAGSVPFTRILLRLGTPFTIAITSPLLLLGAVGYEGMRPEILAIPLLLLGLATLFSKEERWTTFAGAFLIMASAVIAPTCTASAITAICAYLYTRRDNPSRQVVSIILAGSVLGFILLLAINFELHGFLRTFLRHGSSRTSITGGKHVGWVFLAYFLMFTCAYGGITLRKSHPRLDNAGITFLFLVIALAGTLLTHARESIMGIILASMGLAIAAELDSGALSNKRHLIQCVVIIWLAALNLIAARTVDFAPRGIPPRLINPAIQKNTSLVIDSIVARYVYDYQPPRNSIDINFMRPAFYYSPGRLSVQTGDQWLVSEHYLRLQYEGHQAAHTPDEFPRRSAAAAFEKFAMTPFITRPGAYPSKICFVSKSMTIDTIQKFRHIVDQDCMHW